MGGPDVQGKAEVTVTCYRHEIPPFIETELARLYETLHSSLPFFAVCRSLDHVSCYVSRRAGIPVAIFLFTVRDKRIDVLNEMITVDQGEIERFAKHVFAEHERVGIIRFNAVKTSMDGSGFPFQKYSAKDTYCVHLPETPEEYTASIGKSTRASIHRCINGIRRNYPSFCVEFRSGSDIDASRVREILAFSEAKINANGFKLVHDAEKITALAARCGFVSVVLIDGRVCAGMVNYQVGSSYFLDVTGYDSRYEKSGLGKVCTYQTICECIRRGGRKFYFGGGRFDYKERMLGRPLSMDELTIFRSRGAMLRHSRHAVAAALANEVRRLKKFVHQHSQTRLAKLVFDCYYFVKRRHAR